MRSILALVVLLFAVPAPAGEIYRWVDDAGEVHYTDDPASIPANRRKKAKVTQGAELDRVSTERAVTPPTPRATAVETPDAAQDAAVWRAAFRELRGRIEALERTLASDRRALADPAGQGLPLARDLSGAVRPSADHESLKRRIAQTEAELARAREGLEELERKAARQAIPMEWRR